MSRSARHRHIGHLPVAHDDRRTSRDDLRASDADREKAVTLLRAHAAEGRLTLDELEARVERAYAARTTGELKALRADLPKMRLPEDRARSAQRRRAELRDHARSYLAVMLLLVAIWALTGGGYFWVVWPALGWGIGLVSHALPVMTGGGGHHRRALRA